MANPNQQAGWQSLLDSYLGNNPEDTTIQNNDEVDYANQQSVANALQVHDTGAEHPGLLTSVLGGLDWARNHVVNGARELNDMATGHQHGDGSLSSYLDDYKNKVAHHEGFGDLSALKVNSSDNLLTKGLKEAGAFVGDTVTDPVMWASVPLDLVTGGGATAAVLAARGGERAAVAAAEHIGEKAAVEAAGKGLDEAAVNAAKDNAKATYFSNLAAKHPASLEAEAVAKTGDEGAIAATTKVEMVNQAKQQVLDEAAKTGRQLSEEELSTAAERQVDQKLAKRVAGTLASEGMTTQGPRGYMSAMKTLANDDAAHARVLYNNSKKMIPQLHGVRLRTPIGNKTIANITQGGGGAIDKLHLGGAADKLNQVALGIRSSKPARILPDAMGGYYDIDKLWTKHLQDLANPEMANKPGRTSIYDYIEQKAAIEKAIGDYHVLNETHGLQASLKDSENAVKKNPEARDAFWKYHDNPAMGLAQDASENERLGYDQAHIHRNNRNAIHGVAGNEGVVIGDQGPNYVPYQWSEEEKVYQTANRIAEPGHQAGFDSSAVAKRTSAYEDGMPADFADINADHLTPKQINEMAVTLGRRPEGHKVLEEDPLKNNAKYYRELTQRIAGKRADDMLKASGSLLKNPNTYDKLVNAKNAEKLGNTAKAIAKVEADRVSDELSGAQQDADRLGVGRAVEVAQLQDTIDELKTQLAAAPEKDKAAIQDQIDYTRTVKNHLAKNARDVVAQPRKETEAARKAQLKDVTKQINDLKEQLHQADFKDQPAMVKQIEDLKATKDKLAKTGAPAVKAEQKLARQQAEKQAAARLIRAHNNKLSLEKLNESIGDRINKISHLGTQTSSEDYERLYDDFSKLMENAPKSTLKKLNADLRATTRMSKDDLFVGKGTQASAGKELRNLGFANLGNTKGTELKAGFQHYMGSQGIKEALERRWAVQANPGQIEQIYDSFIKPYDTLFRTYATVGRGPAFHINNEIGGAWNNYLAGVKLREIKNATRMAAVVHQVTAEVNKKKISEVEKVKLYNELLEKRLEKITLPNGVNGWKAHELFSEHNLQGTNSFNEAGSAAPKEEIAVKDEAKKKKLNVPAIAQKGADLAKAGGDKLIDNPWTRLNSRWGQGVEYHIRMATFLEGLNRFGTDTVGASLASDFVKSVQFDYSPAALSKAEKTIRKVVPFYVWTRNNLPFQLRELVRDPSRFVKYHRAMVAAQGTLANPDDNQSLLPAWLTQQQGFASGLSPFGNKIAFYAKLPANDLDALLKVPSLNHGISGASPLNLRSAASTITPLLKTGVEQGYDVNTFTGASGAPDTTKTLSNLLPPVGLGMKLVVDPAKAVADGKANSNSQRLLTNALAQVGIPVATLTPSQIEGELKSRANRIAPELSDAAAHAGPDGAAVNTQKLSHLASKGIDAETLRNMIESGAFPVIPKPVKTKQIPQGFKTL